MDTKKGKDNPCFLSGGRIEERRDLGEGETNWEAILGGNRIGKR